MSDPRRVHATDRGPKPHSAEPRDGVDLVTLFRIANAPVAVAQESDADSAVGMSLAEFAAWAGIDRRRLARHLVEISPGPVPLLPAGAVPVRVFGKTRRIFVRDVFGAEGARSPGEANDAGSAQEAHSGSTRGSTWDRSLDLLRRRGTERR